jgi:hypothetical protein
LNLSPSDSAVTRRIRGTKRVRQDELGIIISGALRGLTAGGSKPDKMLFIGGSNAAEQ